MIDSRINIDTGKNPIGFITIEKTTRYGLIKNRKVIPMRSYVKNFWKIIYDIFRPNGTGNNAMRSNIPRWDGTIEYIVSNYPVYTNGGSGANYIGISVGSGNTAFNIEDSSLDSHIPHGNGAGELEYSANTVSRIENGLKTEISRTFVNNSGSAIDVNEMAISIEQDSNSSTNPWMIIRDVFDNPLTIADGEGLSITATWGFTGSGHTRNSAWLTWGWTNGTNYPMYTLNGFERTNDNYWYDWFYHGVFQNAAEDSRKGLCLGTGDKALDITDFDLDNRIPHGTEDNQLYKQAQTLSWNIDTANNKIELIAEGDFSNQGSVDIIVKELGVMSEYYSDYYMHMRDLLSSPSTITAGTSKVARFTISYQA